MHELSIAQALIEQVEKRIPRSDSTAVRSIKVSVGALSGVDPEALETAFAIASEGTRLAEALLAIERVPAVGRCSDCRHESGQEFPFPICSHCGSTNVQLMRGRELLLMSVDIEEPVSKIAGADASGEEETHNVQRVRVRRRTSCRPPSCRSRTSRRMARTSRFGTSSSTDTED